MYLTDASPEMVLMDFLPLLLDMPLSVSRKVGEFQNFQSECWTKIKEIQAQDGGESLTSLFREATGDLDAKLSGKISEGEAKMCNLVLIIAGVTATARALQFMLNTMVFRMDIRHNMREDMYRNVTGQGIQNIHTTTFQDALP